MEYVGRKYRDAIQSSLDTRKDSIEAVLISGGGNDFAGLDDMSRIIRARCEGFTFVDECFNSAQPGQIFDEVGEAYRQLIDMVLAAAPHAKIFLHNYDRAIPTGKGFVGLGNWLKEPMKRARIDPGLHQGIVGRLLFEFTRRLKAQSARSSRRPRRKLFEDQGRQDNAKESMAMHPGTQPISIFLRPETG